MDVKSKLRSFLNRKPQYLLYFATALWAVTSAQIITIGLAYEKAVSQPFLTAVTILLIPVAYWTVGAYLYLFSTLIDSSEEVDKHPFESPVWYALAGVLYFPALTYSLLKDLAGSGEGDAE